MLYFVSSVLRMRTVSGPSIPTNEGDSCGVFVEDRREILYCVVFAPAQEEVLSKDKPHPPVAAYTTSSPSTIHEKHTPPQHSSVATPLSDKEMSLTTRSDERQTSTEGMHWR